MLTAKKALAAARVYTQETAQEMGALKGAPCTIKSIVKSGNLNTVTFEWTDRSEVTHESTMLVYDGTDGQDGDDGFSPTIVIKSSTSTEYILTITDKNGSYDTPNLKGGGGGGASSLSDLDDIALSSLANGDVLVYDSTAGKWKNVQLDIPTQLSDLSDIDLASLADADILKYDFVNQKWVNGKLDYSELTGTPTLGTAAEKDATNAITENSTDLIESGAVYTGLAAKADTADLGTAAAKDSTNAVTQSSTDLVESGAVYTALSDKVDKEADKGLSTNDFTDTEKSKLDNLGLDDLSDVDMTGITDGQVLAWDDANSKMVPADQTGTEYTAGMGVDISAQNEISTEFIMYPGTKAEWDLLPTSEKIKYTHTAWADSQSGIVDNAPTENSGHLVTSGGVFTALSAKANSSDLGTAAAKDSTNAVTQSSTDLVESGAIYTALSAKADTADLGTAAAKDSTNAVTQSSTDLVESGAVYAAIGSAIADLDVSDSAVAGSYVTAVSETDGSISVTREAADVTPTSASTKMLTSGGAYTALADKTDKVTSATNGDFAGLDASGNLTDSGKKASDFATAQGLADEAKTRGAMGAKNLIPMDQVKDSTVNSHGTWSGNVYTDNGVEFTFNPENGTVVANGTSNGGEGTHATFYYAVRSNDSRLNMPANTYKLTGCPAGGSSSTYFLYLNTRYQSDNTNNGGMTDDGEGVTATYANDMWAGVYVDIVNGTTVSNLEFKPMLRLASDIDDTYQPYAKTNKELTDEVSANTSGLADEAATRSAMGAKNLLPLSLNDIISRNTGGTWSTNVYTHNGIDYTVNTDANGSVISVSAIGTASAASFLVLSDIDFGNTKLSTAGTMTANGYTISGGVDNTKFCQYNQNNKITSINIDSGQEILTSIDFYPMIRLASDTDTTYQPYAKTNRELTVDSVSWKNNALLGAKNLIPNLGASRTIGGCTITVNSDGSFTIVQDSTVSSQTFELFNDANNPIELKAPCILSSGADLSNSQLIATIDGTDYYAHENDKTPIVPAGSLTRVRYYFNSSYTGTRTVYPMLRYAFDTDPTYVPYAMTNRQLSAYEKGNITYSIQATETAMTTIIKVGKVVQCNMMAAIGENVSAWTTFATIPEGFRPAFYVQAVNNKTMYTGFNIIQISPQGTVQSATALASGERLRFTAVWILP